MDLELSTAELAPTLERIKKKAECILSYHNLEETPPLNSIRDIVRRQLSAGADICKVVTTARSAEDSLTVLQLIPEFPGARVVTFAMGPLGLVSRVLCPLVGGDFTYASLARGKESASGQMTVEELRKLYEMLEPNR